MCHMGLQIWLEVGEPHFSEKKMEPLQYVDHLWQLENIPLIIL